MGVPGSGKKPWAKAPRSISYEERTPSPVQETRAERARPTVTPADAKAGTVPTSRSWLDFTPLGGRLGSKRTAPGVPAPLPGAPKKREWYHAIFPGWP